MFTITGLSLEPNFMFNLRLFQLGSSKAKVIYHFNLFLTAPVWIESCLALISQRFLICLISNCGIGEQRSSSVSFESNTVESDKEDKIITCKDCGEDFIFTVREQDFYVQKGFTNDPTRCAPCRAARKQGQPRVTNEVNVATPRRDNYNSRPPRPSQPGPNYGNRQDNYGNSGYNNRNDNYNGGGNSYGNNNNNYGNRTDNYANRGARPSYNSSNPGGYNNRNDNYNGGGGNSYGNNNNYGNRNDNSGNRRDNNYGNSGFGQRSNVSNNYGQNQERKLYNIVCSNCGVETQVPFLPRPGVPVFCKSCYNSQKTGRY